MAQAIVQARSAWTIACAISRILRPIAEEAPIWFNNAVPSKRGKESRIEYIPSGRLLAGSSILAKPEAVK